MEGIRGERKDKKELDNKRIGVKRGETVNKLWKEIGV